MTEDFSCILCLVEGKPDKLSEDCPSCPECFDKIVKKYESELVCMIEKRGEYNFLKQNVMKALDKYVSSGYNNRRKCSLCLREKICVFKMNVCSNHDCSFLK
jgi:hypothetical protein